MIVAGVAVFPMVGTWIVLKVVDAPAGLWLSRKDGATEVGLSTTMSARIRQRA